MLHLRIFRTKTTQVTTMNENIAEKFRADGVASLTGQPFCRGVLRRLPDYRR